jgi:hypothetical protein
MKYMLGVRAAVAAGMLLAAAGCSTPTSVQPLSIPLAYKPMADARDYSALPACAAVADVQAVDARSEKVIGRRSIEGNATAVAPVRTTGDMAAWARTAATETLKRSRVTVGGTGAIFRVTIEQIRTNENVLHRSGYDAQILVSARLSRGGSVCWQGRAEGKAENYGYSGSVENYQETLNHALDRAMIQLLTRPGLHSAICSCR